MQIRSYRAGGGKIFYTKFFLKTVLILFWVLFGTLYAEDAVDAASLRLKFVNEAYKYLNVPYKYTGDSKNGIDCSGLIYRAALDSLNMKLPRTAKSISQYAKKIKTDLLEAGDLVFFNTSGGISHVGIYLGGGKFIHAASGGKKTGVIISSLGEKYWKKTYLFAGRIFPSSFSK